MAGVAIDVWNLRGSSLVRCSRSAAWTRKPELGAGAPEQGPLLLFKDHLMRKSGPASATPWLTTNFRQARRLLPCRAVPSCSSGLHDAPHSSLHDEVATFRERARELGHRGLDPAEGLWLVRTHHCSLLSCMLTDTPRMRISCGRLHWKGSSRCCRGQGPPS